MAEMSIAALDAKIETLRELIREANGTLSDIRAERRATEKLIQDFRADTVARLNSTVEAAVESGLKDLGQSIETAIGNATEAVYRRFDVISDALTGNDPESRAAGKKPLDVLARQVRAKQEAAGP